MGYDVGLTGKTTRKDGGFDIIAVPKIRPVGSFILAGQIKHHWAHQRTGREAVDRLLAWKDSVFGLGLLVTNTAFTRDAVWMGKARTQSGISRKPRVSNVSEIWPSRRLNLDDR